MHGRLLRLRSLRTCCTSPGCCMMGENQRIETHKKETLAKIKELPIAEKLSEMLYNHARQQPLSMGMLRSSEWKILEAGTVYPP